MILSADWSISRLQSWTCSSLSTVAEFVKLMQSFVIEIQRQSADLYKVQLCNRQFFVVSTPIYVVKVYECHPLDMSVNLQNYACEKLNFKRKLRKLTRKFIVPLQYLKVYDVVFHFKINKIVHSFTGIFLWLKKITPQPPSYSIITYQLSRTAFKNRSKILAFPRILLIVTM